MSYLITLALVFSIITASIGQIALKKGAWVFSDLKFSFSAIFNMVFSLLQNKWLLAGTLLFIISFFSYIFVLSKIQLNFAYPFMVSLGIVLVAVGSKVFLGEQLSLRNIVGIVLIIFGILLLIPKN